VQALAAYRRSVGTRGGHAAFAADGVHVAGIGKVSLFAVADLDGNLTEFYEPPAGGGR
jgi:hypothetical protein